MIYGATVLCTDSRSIIMLTSARSPEITPINFRTVSTRAHFYGLQCNVRKYSVGKAKSCIRPSYGMTGFCRRWRLTIVRLSKPEPIIPVLNRDLR